MNPRIESDMKYVLEYTSSDDIASLAPMHFPAHRQRWAEFQARGDRLMIGPYSDRSGALAIFKSRAAAEEFVASDPFVLHGVVKSWDIREWSEALT